MTLRPAFGKNYCDIAREWDEIALIRLNQIESGQDLSYKYIIIPTIFDLLRQCNLSKVVDLGCGSGILTKHVAEKAEHVVGVDISKENIRLAQRNSLGVSNLDYVNIDIESFVDRVKESNFTTAIANMTLMTVLNLEQVLLTTRSILKPDGHLVFTITHPCYWPLYWNYAYEEWFNYLKEIPIEADFKISLDKYEGCVTTHIHRPMQMYLNTLNKTGFKVTKIVEPMPSREVQEKYPLKWVYPRFLGVRCVLERRRHFF